MECCKVIAVRAAINPQHMQTKHFYETRGCKIIPTDVLPLIVIPYKCVHLTDAGCSIYDKRPAICRNYDGRKDPVMFYTCLWGRQG